MQNYPLKKNYVKEKNYILFSSSNSDKNKMLNKISNLTPSKAC